MYYTFRKLWDFLSPRERRNGLLLLVLMLVRGPIEMAGVASIFPLIAVLSDPALIESNHWLKLAYDTLGFTSLNAFFIFLSSAVFAMMVLRTLFAAFTSYALLRYAQMRTHTLSVRLLGSYLRRPYAFFLNRHSADMGRSVLSEVEQVIGGSLMPALQLVSQTIIATFIVSVVILVDPLVATIILSSMIGVYGLIYFTIRRYLSRKGQDQIAANIERFRVAQEVLGGVKEVKIGGQERGYLGRFERASFRFSWLRSQLNLIREVPRYLLELIAVGGILAVILALLFRSDGNLTTALPTIAIYAFAGLRLLPAIQIIYQAIVSMRFGRAALDTLHEDLFEADHATDLAATSPMDIKREIRLNHVSFSYPTSERQALRDVSMVIPVHTTVGIVGATGAGKSTIVDIILGLLEPQSGVLQIDGETITRSNVRAWQRSIGYVPQQIFIADETIAANIALGVAPNKIDFAAVEKAARLSNLHDFIVDELPKGYATEVGDRGIRLSGGQRQRLGIARALYSDPHVLILDEATSALDNLTEKSVMDSLKNLAQQKIIIMIAHRLSTVRDCDNIFHMKDGKIISSAKFSSLLKNDEFRNFALVESSMLITGDINT